MPVTTIQELWQVVMKDEVPQTKAYYKSEYYLGQAISMYGAESVIQSHNESEAIFEKPFKFLEHVPANGIGVGPPKPE